MIKAKKENCNFLSWLLWKMMKKFVKKNWCVTFVALTLCAMFVFVGCFGKSGADKTAAPMETMQNIDLAEEPQFAETEANNTAPVY